MQVAKRSKCVAAIKPRTEAETAEVMWVYYRANKAQLVSQISENRALILADMIAGMLEETAFAPYLRPVAQVGTVRRAA